MASSSDPPPSRSTDIENVATAKQAPPLPWDGGERLDHHRVQEDIRTYRESLARMQGGTEPATAYRNVLLTEKQINYLLVILKPYLSPIAEECRVKLESA
jgi:hypothetical protein